MSQEATKEITLSDGRIATVTKWKVKNLYEAQTSVGSKDENLLQYALIASCTKIDGNPITPEELLEMDGDDGLLIMGAFGENFSSQVSK